MMDVKINRRSDDTTFGAETFSWQDPIHSWKAGPGEVMTVENLLKIFIYMSMYIVHTYEYHKLCILNGLFANQTWLDKND